MLKLMEIRSRTNHRRILKGPSSFAPDQLDPDTKIKKIFQRFWRRQIESKKHKKAPSSSIRAHQSGQ
ncbi:MAG: hypothetical protein GKR89_08240 [Candidatus Latescibacteria bacterium]|nr:hypothetical protein [Candidatus Latescibacterota bacterium]